MDGTGPPDEIRDMLIREHKALQDAIKGARGRIQDLSIAEIVRLYHMAMGVSSTAGALKAMGGGGRLHDTVMDDVGEMFDRGIHPSIMGHLAESVGMQTAELKKSKGRDGKKSGGGVRDAAAPFDRLRETMSTKEFVEQYDWGLGHD